MRLTQVLDFYIHYKKVQGLIRYGKHRVIPPISISLKRKVAELMVIEKKNVDILNKPYLSKDAEKAYFNVVERVVLKTPKQLRVERRQGYLDNLPPAYRTETLLENLNKNKKWE